MIGVGACRPQRLVTNDELCSTTLDSSDEWIFERSGIRARRWISGDESAKSMAVTAGERAIINSGIDRTEIDAVVLATSTWPVLVPHGAPTIAYELGINGVPAFDLVAGCGGFGYGVAVVTGMIQSGLAKNVLLLGVETMSPSLDKSDRGTAFLFGDGAGAVIISAAEENGISPAVWGSDGENAHAIGQSLDIIEYMDRAVEMQKLDPETDPVGKMVLTMEGQAVFRWAAITLPKALAGALDTAGLSADDIEVFVPHQANARINELMKKHLGLPDDLPMANDIEFTGNTSAASIPLAIEEMLATGKAKGGQTALLLGFGAGLSYAAMVAKMPPAPKVTSFDDLT